MRFLRYGEIIESFEMDIVAPNRLELHFDIERPVELTDLTLAFNGLARDYRKFLVEHVRTNGGKIKGGEVKLYVTKIESNCILAELAGATPILGAIISMMDYKLIFMDYIAHVRRSVEYFGNIGKLGKVDPQKLDVTKAQCTNFSDFAKIVAENEDGKLGLKSLEYLDDTQERRIHVKAEFSASEILEARRGALIASKALEYRGDADHKEVLMYFHQTNLDDAKAKGVTGDKAVVASISDKPLPVHFISDLDRDRVRDLKDDEGTNPLKLELRVDVNVEKNRNDVPRFYRVLHVHEIIQDEEDDDT